MFRNLRSSLFPGSLEENHEYRNIDADCSTTTGKNILIHAVPILQRCNRKPELNVAC